jgi:hypothetical protein
MAVPGGPGGQIGSLEPDPRNDPAPRVPKPQPARGRNAGRVAIALYRFALTALSRVVIVDDHHAVRLGHQMALEAEPGLVPVGTASTAGELAPLLDRVDPDVVLLD